MLRTNQWIIQENSDLLSDIYGFHLLSYGIPQTFN
nr:MAG TPA: hypothetical protein [Caudoviricetes sp.]